MKRFCFRISYNGTHYFGWQRQPREVSVQEVIEDCFYKILSKIETTIFGCGRTDTGVHANEYFFHVDLPDATLIDDLIYRLNRMLPKGVAIKSARVVASDFHARYDARNRTYRYYIHTTKDPFLSEMSCELRTKFSIEKMNEACQYLIGKKDFTSLSKIPTEVKSTICEVRKAQWVQIDDYRFYFEISADRFLRNMVRATVGTLLEIGHGKMQPSDMQVVLDKMDRSAAAVSVPAQGLFLWKIDY